MPSVHKISSVSFRSNNRIRKVRNNQNRTFLANKPESAMPIVKDSLFNRFVSKALDKMSPALFKNSRTSKKYFTLGETLAKKVANISE